MPRILISGASSGLGLAFTLHYIHLFSQPSQLDHNSTIYALDRHPGSTIVETILNHCTETATKHWVDTHVLPLSVDVTNAQHITYLSGVFAPTARPTQFVGLQLVIHCAGIRGLVSNGSHVSSYEDVRQQETFEVMDAHTMRQAFEVNVLGTFELLRACLPALRAAATAADTASQGNEGSIRGERQQSGTPKVIVMGSRMGSISNNTLPNANAGAAYAYRCSKAAVNALVRSFAADVPGVVWTVVHPGRVETGLVRVKEDSAIGAEESVGDMVALIDRLGRVDSGGFVDRFGGEIGW